MLPSTITAGIIALSAALALSGGTASAKTTGKTRALPLRVTVGVVNVQARSLSIVLRMKPAQVLGVQQPSAPAT